MLIDAKKKELLVLYAITQHDTCSLQELSYDLRIPKRTIKELIRKLNLTIEQRLAISSFIYSTPKGEIKIDPSYQESKMMIYTHLDVYKRQVYTYICFFLTHFKAWNGHLRQLNCLNLREKNNSLKSY
ncbi:hypothetical protein A5844_001569 [Enterococcus sp. 10A9_DIV0425]|uniref:Mga helix-turn-helix domain-containing protein n=1 Tax=Candidatus Enterococcus wittei TaxID=1987383 RepID=A0A242K2D4_9ENTE|nr:hypothetical protein [Enterococcus sp. 10A9_DIV0425]OTP11434.1 hypothetical protein A5844_001569 [Enterococcus sp. 10A9_DIV0425]